MVNLSDADHINGTVYFSDCRDTLFNLAMSLKKSDF